SCRPLVSAGKRGRYRPLRRRAGCGRLTSRSHHSQGSSMKSLSLAVLAGLLLATPAFAADRSIESCDTVSSFDAVPSRVITLNQQATEIMLALGLEAHLVGTAYLDDAIPA